MDVIQEARTALDNITAADIARVAQKRGLDPQAMTERIAYRRTVLDRGGLAAAETAAIILNRRVKGVRAVAANMRGHS